MGIKSLIAAICNMTYSSFTPKNPGVLHVYGLPDQFFQSLIILFSDKNMLPSFLAIGVQLSFPYFTTSDSGVRAGI